MSTQLWILFGCLIGVVGVAALAIIIKGMLKYSENMAMHRKPLSGVPHADEVTLVSHRGLGSVAPENTLAAFRKTGEAGFEYCECDIHATADGEFVVGHDTTLNRMTDKAGEIALMTLEQVKEAHINNGSNHKIYTDQLIPTLEEYLDVCNEFKMHPVIEIKLKGEFDVNKFCNILRSKKVDKSAVVIGYNVEFLKMVREVLPEVKLQILCHNISEEVIEQALSLDKCGIDVMQNLLFNKALVKKAIDSGIEMNSWTVDTPRTLKRMYDMGIRMATTNCILPVKE